MKDTDIEMRIKAAVENTVPNVLGNILSECEEQKGKVVSMEKTNKKKRWIATISAVAAALVLVVCGTVYGSYADNSKVDSVIEIDVNPSIELKVSKSEKILEANAVNEDAKIILEEMDLKGTDLDVAVNAIIGSMVKNGYISDLANSVLVSVENADSARSAELQKKVSDEIAKFLNESSINADILSQIVNKNSSLPAWKDEYGISSGKAMLIQQILDLNTTLTPEMLVGLSINELNLILESSGMDATNINSTGNASDKAYIGQNVAKKIAFDHAGTTEDKVSRLEVKMDVDDGHMVYDVEFHVGNVEYEYEINAVTGAIIDVDRDVENDSNNSASTGSAGSGSNYIGADKATAVAYKHAGVSASDVRKVEVDFDYDNGVAIYEVEFKIGNTEYDYDINAATGAVVKAKKETDDDYKGSESIGQSANYISENQAKSIAFKHAGVSESSVQWAKVELEHNDGVTKYEVEFKVGNIEYDYDINAKSGTIIKYNIND